MTHPATCAGTLTLALRNAHVMYVRTRGSLVPARKIADMINPPRMSFTCFVREDPLSSSEVQGEWLEPWCKAEISPVSHAYRTVQGDQQRQGVYQQQGCGATVAAMRTALCRVISDDRESSSSKDDRGKLKAVTRKVKHLFGKADKEEENQAADFEDDDDLDALEEEEEERAEADEQQKDGATDEELDKEKLLYWEVRLRS